MRPLTLAGRLRSKPLMSNSLPETYVLSLTTKGGAAFGLGSERVEVSTDSRDLVSAILQHLVSANVLALTDSIEVTATDVGHGYSVELTYNAYQGEEHEV